MTDVLEHEGYLRQADLSPKQVVVVVLQFAVRKVIPPAILPFSVPLHGWNDEANLRARITIQQRRGLNELPAVLAPFALKRLVRLAKRVLVEQEELP